MVVMTDSTKIQKLNKAFAELIAESIAAGDKPSEAKKIMNAFEALGPESKVKLFDLILQLGSA